MAFQNPDGSRYPQRKREHFKFLGSDATEQIRNEVYAFLQGAVYCWCNVKKGDEFAFRKLFGDENANWNGTPLQKIYDHFNDGSVPEKQAYDSARQVAGKMLREVLDGDRRNFTEEHHSLTQNYTWQKENS